MRAVEKEVSPDTEKACSVVLEDVSVSFSGNPGTKVLDNISLQIREGEFVALVGKSGCGKTTILNLLAGLIEPKQGNIRIHGKEAAEGREHIGYMFARDCLFPWRRAQKNVEMPLEAKGVPAEERRARARRELKRVGLGNFADYYPKSLSHGMRQRVAIARTWVLDPDILLMDEPFAALDAQTRLTLERDFLKQWAERASTVIFVTHDLPEAIALADRVIVLGKGKIIYDDKMPFGWPRDPETVLADPRFGKVFAEIRDLLG
ncbi:ABC transporter ATP-binding protein [Mesorhizobium liriopis]|uniref:ABC transporter ATP-binding protein n=1 Tax=Mesorhizobium liriopis TaxID=2953882 RepID=UPI002094021B|nr:ABC transporter ATP-binding protein [Mesorhizobium liriopis]